MRNEMRYERWTVKFSCAMGLLCGALALAAHGLPNLDSRPPVPDANLVRLIGEYGTSDPPLTVYEARGHLYANGGRLQQAPLRQLTADRFVTEGKAAAGGGSSLRFVGDHRQPAVAIDLDGARLPRRDVGAEVIRTIRAAVRSDVATLRESALRATPPAEAAARSDELIALAGVDATIKLDIRYATTDNFMGFPLYDRAGAYLQRPAAEALGRVARSLAPLGYGLVIHDAYRPWFVTKMFWDATPDAAHIFVADPASGSRHNRGCAVDLTLYELATGAVADMPGRYDEMSQRSFADYVGGTSRERWLRDLLRQAMMQQGFTVYPQEWWHFDYRDWHEYGIGNASFDRLEAPPRGA